MIKPFEKIKFYKNKTTNKISLCRHDRTDTYKEVKERIEND